MVIVLLKNNIECFLSKVGHKNFYYPTSTRAILKKNTKIQILTWLCSNKNLCAAKVKNKDILFLTITDKNVNIKKDAFSVVWIDKVHAP